MLAAVVPVKTPPLAKGRLARVLHPAERRALVQTMLGDVLAALLASQGIARVGVISADADVLAQARALGAESLRDQGADLNAALEQAAQYYAAEGAHGLLVLPADVPLATPAALEQLIALAPQQGAAIVPSRDGGTNALLVQPPLALPFRFGPASLQLHRQAAQERGLPLTVADIAGVNLDVDQADDLLLLAERDGSTATQRLLRELSVTERVMCV